MKNETIATNGTRVKTPDDHNQTNKQDIEIKSYFRALFYMALISKTCLLNIYSEKM